MSGRFKRCKVCGTSKAADFAPRKSAICKVCDSNSGDVKNDCEVSKNDTPDTRPLFETSQYANIPEIEKFSHIPETQKESGFNKENVKETFPKISSKINNSKKFVNTKTEYSQENIDNYNNLDNSFSKSSNVTPPNSPDNSEFQTINENSINYNEENFSYENSEQTHIFVLKEDFESILSLVAQLEIKVTMLQKDVNVLKRIKNMFPLLFPKDEEI